MKKFDIEQLELECEGERVSSALKEAQSSEDELMDSIDRVISDTTKTLRPYLNRMVRDVERLLEGSFIKSPGSNLLDDLIEGMEKDIRKFVDEVKALKRWNQPHPPHSSSE